MKKLLQFSFIYCLIIFFSHSMYAQSYELKVKKVNNYTYEAELTIFNMEASSVTINEETYKKFNIEKGSKLVKAGFPELPVIHTFIAAPAGNYKIDIIELQQVKLKATPAPAPKPQLRNNSKPDTAVVFGEIYNSNSIFPAQQVELMNQGNIGGAAVATLAVYPVTYDAANKIIAISKKVRFTVTFSQTIPEIDAYSNTLFSIGPERSNPNLSSFKKNKNTKKTPHLLIVTHDDFYESILLFAEWKRKKGFSVKTMKASELGEVLYYETVKEALQREYEAQQLDYVLLVGDYNFIPPDYGLGNSLTDHNYTLLAGDDYFSDVMIGRFSVNTAAECKVYVEKLLAYEQLQAEGQWYNSATVIASDDFNDNENGKHMVNVFAEAGFGNVDDLRERMQTNTTYNVSNALNDGRGWVFFIGHGSAHGWLSVSPEFSNNSLEALTAGKHLSTVVSIACANSDIDVKGDDCFAERWMNIEKGKGASNILAATEDVVFFWSDTLGKQTVISYLNREAETFGAAVNYGKMKMYEAFPEPAKGVTHQTMEQFIILGDPTQMPWTAAPAAVDVQYPAVLKPGQQEVTIKVTKDGGAVADAMVCLSNAELQFAGYTDENGEVVLEVDVQEGGIFDMVVSGYNLQVFQKQVQVREQLIASSVRVDVYPNPSSGVFNFSYKNSLPKQFLIADIQGRMIYSTTTLPAHTFQYDAAATPAGVYFYTFVFEDGSRFGGKIILNRK